MPYYPYLRRSTNQALVRALQLDPFHVESNYNMGNLLREVGHLEKSVEHYR